jgi:hypothetical protein
MEAVYRGAGFGASSAVEPDHLGQAFGFLAFLSEKEAGALEAGALEAGALETGEGAAAVQQQQLDFLVNQLLPWLIPCVIAVEEQGDAFYGLLARLALGLAADHYGALKTADLTPTSIALPILAEQPGLEDGRTGLRDIARYLITPSQAGFYLGRGDINRLARAVSLPHGFGSREQMLQTLLEAAGQYDSTLGLLAALLELAGRWRARYEGIGDEYGETAEFVGPWLRRLEGTEGLLRGMEVGVSQPTYQR